KLILYRDRDDANGNSPYGKHDIQHRGWRLNIRYFLSSFEHKPTVADPIAGRSLLLSLWIVKALMGPIRMRPEFLQKDCPAALFVDLCLYRLFSFRKRFGQTLGASPNRETSGFSVDLKSRV